MRRTILCAAIAAALLTCGCEREKLKVAQEENTELSPHDQLKTLDWLIGSWIDTSDNVDVTSTFEWDADNHFIIQHFSMKKGDEPPLTGQQIIAWDPAEKKIRSWVFDSDGGFGQSLWSGQGDIWYAQTLYTLPDGRKASATHVYTKVDNNTYTFASEGRDIDGKMLPDIGPFKAVRAP